MKLLKKDGFIVSHAAKKVFYPYIFEIMLLS